MHTLMTEDHPQLILGIRFIGNQNRLMNQTDHDCTVNRIRFSQGNVLIGSQHLSGDRDVRYLDCYDDYHRQRYRVERADTLQPGTYRLTCAARSDGTGACIYVIVGDQKPLFKEIPATGNTGGDIWVEADKFVHNHHNVPIPSDSVAYCNMLCELHGVNGHKGYGWNRITFEPIRVTAPTVIRYGLTSDDAFTRKTWLGKWFSATDFEVKRWSE